MNTDIAIQHAPNNPKAAPMTKLAWALELVRRGAGIVPLHAAFPDGSCSCHKGKECRGAGKHPLHNAWQLNTLKTEAAVRAWHMEHPDANYGANLAGIGFILDIDEKDGKNGINNLLAYINEPRKAEGKPAIGLETLKSLTFTVESPSGGLHLYFLYDREVGNPDCGIEGIDIRGVGGQCVGPKSIVYMMNEDFELAPVPYKVINAKEFAKAPAAILSLLTLKPERAANADDSVCKPTVDCPAAYDAGREFLETWEVATQGEGGDAHTVLTARKLRDLNLSEKACLELMTEDGGWNDACNPPWLFDDLERKVRSAYKNPNEPMGNRQAYLMELFCGQIEGYARHPDAADSVGITAILQDMKRQSADEKRKAAKRRQELPEVTQAKRRRFLPMSHFEQDNIPQEKYIVEGLLAEKNIAWFYGPTGAYKTYGLVALLLALAAGHAEWCGFPLATDGGNRKWKVIYVSGEGGMSLVTERKVAWLQKHGLTSADVEFYPVIGNMPNLLDGKDVEAFLDDITSPKSPCPDPDIIVWDTYSRATPGADGNSTKELSILIDEVERMKNEKLPSLKLAGLVDHTGLDENRQRGTTGKSQNADAVIRINRPAGNTKLKSVWTPEKVRNGDPPEPFTVDSTLEEIDFRNVSGANVRKTVPVFDVRGAKTRTGGMTVGSGGPLAHYKSTGGLTETDMVRIALDKEEAGTKLSVGDVVDRVDQLFTLEGKPETRRGNFEKWLRRTLAKNTAKASKDRSEIAPFVEWKHKAGGTVYTFTGQGGAIGAAKAFEESTQFGLIERETAETESGDAGE